MGRHPEFDQKIWDFIRACADGMFSAPYVAANTGVKYYIVLRYLTKLARAGYIKRVARTLSMNTFYSLERDTGVEAPRLSMSGAVIKDGRGMEQMWRAMRILKDFSTRDLAVKASTEETPVSYKAAIKYVKALYNAGYLRLTAKGRSGCAGMQTRYALNRHMNTGPKPPAIRANGTVYDPNIGRVMEAAP